MKFKLEIAMKSLSLYNTHSKKRSKLMAIGSEVKTPAGTHVEIKFNERGVDEFVYFKVVDGWISEFSRMGMFRIEHKDVYSIANDGYKSTKIAVRGFTCPEGVESDGAKLLRFYGTHSIMGCIESDGAYTTKDEREFFWGKPSVQIGDFKLGEAEGISIPNGTTFIKEAMIDEGSIIKETKKSPRGYSYQMAISKLRKELSQAEDEIRQLEIEIGIANKTLVDVRSSLKCPEGANVVRFAEIVRCMSLGGVHSDQVSRRAAAVEDVIHHKNQGAFSDEVLQKIMVDIVNDDFYDDTPF